MTHIDTVDRLEAVDLYTEIPCGWGKGGQCTRPATWRYQWNHKDDGEHPGSLNVCVSHHRYSRMQFAQSDRFSCADPCHAELAVTWRKL